MIALVFSLLGELKTVDANASRARSAGEVGTAAATVIASITQGFLQLISVELLHAAVGEDYVALLGMHGVQPTRTRVKREIGAHRDLEIGVIDRRKRFHELSKGSQVAIRAKIMVAGQERGRVRRCCVNADKVTGIQIIRERHCVCEARGDNPGEGGSKRAGFIFRWANQ